MGIEEEIEDIIKDDNPQAQAVKSLIKVEDRKKGQLGSDIELKTELTDEQVCVHTTVDIMTNIIEMTPEEFSKKCIIGNLVNLKERKLLSKNRQSRKEIVDIARQPDIRMMGDQQQGGFVRNLFRSRKNEMP